MQGSRLLAAALVLLLWAPVVRAQATNSIVEDYTLTGWTEREGLASPRVIALAQSADGYLWLGTADGLTQFDGSRFLKWTDFNTAPLPEGRIATLCSSRDGSLWVGYGTGTIARIYQGRVTTLDGSEKSITGGDVGVILEDRDGVIWAATRNGLLKFHDGEWERVGATQGLPDGPVLSAYQDQAGDFWAASYTGVYRKPAGTSHFEAVVSASYFAHRVTRDATGTVWITDSRTGFRRISDPPGSWISTSPQLPQALGVQLLPDTRGNLWVATLGHGLWRARIAANTPTIDVLSRKDGLLNDLVRCLLEDRQGNLWLGTDYGLYRLSPNKLIPLADLGVVRVVEPGADGSTWVGTTTGLVRFKDNTRRVYGLGGELPSPFVTALHRDQQGRLWIATDRGLAMFANERFSPVPVRDAERLNRIYSIAADSGGAIWLCDFSQGLFRLHDGELTPIDVGRDLSHHSIISIHGDRGGRFWVSLSGGGLGFIEEGHPIRFTRITDAPVAGARLNSVFHDQAGSVWLGTSAGVWRYRDGRMVSISAKNGLPSSQVFSTVFDRDGLLWLATASGIVRLDPAAFDLAMNDPSVPVGYGLWDSYDGSAGLPVWLGAPNGARDAAGNLWFVTANGISIADPGRLRVSAPVPPVIIQRLIAGASRFDQTARVRLPPNTSPVQIDYTTVMLSSAHKVRFRYRLDDFDADWTDAGSRREALFTNLPPGAYRFRVSAIATDGSTNDSSATIDFAIDPAFYQVRWFYLALVAVLACAIWQAWRLRLRYAQRQFALVINERIRMSREIHDTLLQSMIGVALQLDVLAAATNVTADARATLIRVRRQLEDDIRETRQSIWSLRSPQLEKTDLAATLGVAGRRLTAGTSAQFTLTVTGTPHRCALDVEQQLLRIGEQAIVNSARHASATRVDVTLGYHPDRLLLRVADDGRGFDQAQDVSGDGGHYGLAGMKERAEEIGGSLSIDTHPGGGTVIEAVIPL